MSTDPGFSVEPAALLNQAQEWVDQALHMGKIAQQVAEANYSVPSYSIFAPAVGVYTKGCERIAQLCSEGQVQMDDIASALIVAVNQYGQADQATMNSVQVIENEINGLPSQPNGPAEEPGKPKEVNVIDQVINVKR
jgi:hypothetical protein